MPAAKVLGDGDELFLNFGFAQGDSAPDDVDDARGISGNERANQHPGCVWPQSNAGGMNAQAAHDCGTIFDPAATRRSSASDK